MNDNGCIHLNNFKAAKGTNPYKIVHAFFVSCTSFEARRYKVSKQQRASLIKEKKMRRICTTPMKLSSIISVVKSEIAIAAFCAIN